MNVSDYPVQVDGRRLDDLAIGLETASLTTGALRSADQPLAGLDGEVPSLNDSREPGAFTLGCFVKGVDEDGFVPVGADSQAVYQRNLETLKHLLCKTGTLLEVRRVVDRMASGILGTGVTYNLLENPTFRGSIGNAEVRRNIFSNPEFRAVATGAPTAEVRRNTFLNPGARINFTWWTHTLQTGATGTLSQVAAGGPAGVVASFVRMTVDTVTDGNIASTGIIFGSPSAGSMTATPGTRHAVSVYARSSVGDRSLNLVVTAHAADGTGQEVVYSGPGVLSAGNWIRLSCTFTVPAGKPNLYVRIYSAAGRNWQVGDTMDATAVLSEQAGRLGSWFDGSSAAANGLTYSWTGTVGSSASIATGVRVGTSPTGAAAGSNPPASWQSWEKTGGGSNPYTVGLNPGAYVDLQRTDETMQGLVAGQPTTISAEVWKDDDAGSFQFILYTKTTGGVFVPQYATFGGQLDGARISATLTIPADATTAFWRLQNNPADDATVAHVTRVLVEALPRALPYFDGDTPAVVRRNYMVDPTFVTAGGWTGVAAGGVVQVASTYSANVTAVPGETWTASIDITAPAGGPAITGNIGARPTTGGAFGGNTYSPTVFNVPAGTTQRISDTHTLVAGANGLRLAVAFDAVPAGLKLGRALLEKIDTVRPYFDGNTASDGLDYSWSGAANNSESVASEALTYEWLGAANVSQSRAVGATPNRWASSTGYFRLWRGADGASVRVLVVQENGGIYPTTASPAEDGDVFSHAVVADADAPDLGPAIRLRHIPYDAAGASIAGGVLGDFTDVSEPTRLTLENVPAATNPDVAGVRQYVFFGGGSLGRMFTLREAITVEGATVPDYFDGNSGGAGWSGTPDLSYAVRGDGDVRASCKVVDAITPDDQPGDYGRLTAVLKVLGSYWRSVALLTNRITSVVSGTEYEVGGLETSSAPVEDAIVVLTGPADAGTWIQDVATGYGVRLNEAIPAGQAWRVNAGTWESRLGAGLTVDSPDTDGADKAGVTDQSGTYPRLLRLHPRDDGTGRRVVQIKVEGAGFTSATTLDVKARRAHL